PSPHSNATRWFRFRCPITYRVEDSGERWYLAISQMLNHVDPVSVGLLWIDCGQVFALREFNVFARLAAERLHFDIPIQRLVRIGDIVSSDLRSLPHNREVSSSPLECIDEGMRGVLDLIVTVAPSWLQRRATHGSLSLILDRARR